MAYRSEPGVKRPPTVLIVGSDLRPFILWGLGVSLLVSVLIGFGTGARHGLERTLAFAAIFALSILIGAVTFMNEQTVARIDHERQVLSIWHRFRRGRAVDVPFGRIGRLTLRWLDGSSDADGYAAWLTVVEGNPVRIGPVWTRESSLVQSLVPFAKALAQQGIDVSHGPCEGIPPTL